VVVIALGITAFALTRQIGVIYERVAPAGALTLSQAIKLNDVAPEIAALTLGGEKLILGGTNLARAQLLLFVAPDCPICKTLIPTMKSLALKTSKTNFILVSDGGEPGEHEGYIKQHDLSTFAYVLSEVLSMSYGIAKLPYAVLIRANGTVGSLGVVDSPEHLERLFKTPTLLGEESTN